MSLKHFFYPIFLFFVCSCSNNEVNEVKDLPVKLNFSGSKYSCADFFVAQLYSEETSNVSLKIGGAGKDNLNLTSEYQNFSIPNSNLTIEIQVWDISMENYFCNDAIFQEPTLLDSWTATSGNLQIKVSDIQVYEFDTFYTISLRLENIVFEKSNGEKRTIETHEILNNGVGWYAG